jgi:hypothetical protein
MYGFDFCFFFALQGGLYETKSLRNEIWRSILNFNEKNRIQFICLLVLNNFKNRLTLVPVKTFEQRRKKKFFEIKFFFIGNRLFYFIFYFYLKN